MKNKCITAAVKHGCYCDLGMDPDGCVLDKNEAHMCDVATKLIEAGKVRDDCHYWRPIEMCAPERIAMWQPIDETTPRDGTLVLLTNHSGRMADGHWNSEFGVWAWPYVLVAPTHWMPRPESPEVELRGAPLLGQITRKSAELELIDIRAALPDDFSPSKDWKFDSGIVQRIEWLKAMLRNSQEEAELAWSQINMLVTLLRDGLEK